MDINKEEIKKTLLEKTEGIRKVLDSKPAVKGLLGKKLLVALVGMVLVAGIAVGCNGKKSSSKSEDSSKSASQEKKQTLSPKKVPEYLKSRGQEKRNVGLRLQRLHHPREPHDSRRHSGNLRRLP